MNTNYSVRNGEVYSKHIFAGNTRLATKMEKRKGTGAPTDLGLYYYHGDHLGSSNAITNGSGNFHEHVEYFPYGETWVEERVAGGENLPHKFTGKELDPETGLYYYGYRYRDARVITWLSADPALSKFLPSGNNNENLPAGGVFRPSNLGIYIYSSNNPIVYVDPDGQWDHKIHLGSSEWGGTFKWAQDKGISSGDAQKIASANNNTDTGRTDPRYRIQDHHFNTNSNPDTFPNNSSSGTSGDSRIQLSEKHLEEAVKLWKLADQFESSVENKGDVQGLRDASLEHLGMGMHALQDVYAHSDEFVGRLIGRWSHYNAGSLGSVPRDRAGPFADDPKVPGRDGRNRVVETRNATYQYLDRFIEGAGYLGDKR